MARTRPIKPINRIKGAHLPIKCPDFNSASYRKYFRQLNELEQSKSQLEREPKSTTIFNRIFSNTTWILYSKRKNIYSDDQGSQTSAFFLWVSQVSAKNCENANHSEKKNVASQRKKTSLSTTFSYCVLNIKKFNYTILFFVFQQNYILNRTYVSVGCPAYQSRCWMQNLPRGLESFRPLIIKFISLK